jgi:hypothetical protein
MTGHLVTPYEGFRPQVVMASTPAVQISEENTEMTIGTDSAFGRRPA